MNKDKKSNQKNPHWERLMEAKRSKRMGKYAEALGVWKNKIGNISHDLTPKMGDNDKIASIINAYSQNKNSASLMKSLRTLYVEFVLRDYPQDKPEEQELLAWAEHNQMEIMEEMLVAYKWQTREDMAKAKKEQGDMVKNLMTDKA